MSRHRFGPSTRMTPRKLFGNRFLRASLIPFALFAEVAEHMTVQGCIRHGSALPFNLRIGGD